MLVCLSYQMAVANSGVKWYVWSSQCKTPATICIMQGFSITNTWFLLKTIYQNNCWDCNTKEDHKPFHVECSSVRNCYIGYGAELVTGDISQLCVTNCPCKLCRKYSTPALNRRTLNLWARHLMCCEKHRRKQK